MRELLHVRDIEALNRAFRRVLERAEGLARECLMSAGCYSAADNRHSVDITMSVWKDRVEDLVTVEKGVQSALDAWATGEKTAEQALESMRQVAVRTQLGVWEKRVVDTVEG